MLSNVFIATAKNISANNGCLSGWNGSNCLGYSMTPAEYALWGLITIIGIAGMIYGVMNVFGMS